MTNIEWKKFSWEVVKGLALGVAAIASFLANQNSEQTKIAVEQTRIQLDKEKQQAELDMKAFEFVEKILTLNPEKAKGQGLAAAAIVNALTKPPLRDGLQSALGAVYPIGAIGDAQKFDAEQADLNFSAPPPPTQKQSSLSADTILAQISNNLIPSAQAQELDGYRVDIFYCEDASHAITEKRERQANEAKKKILTQEPAAKLRVRLLPTLVQARPGYQVFSDEIRYSKADNEDQSANKLSKIINLPPSNIAYSTPKYISVFYCKKE